VSPPHVSAEGCIMNWPSVLPLRTSDLIFFNSGALPNILHYITNFASIYDGSKSGTSKGSLHVPCYNYSLLDDDLFHAVRQHTASGLSVTVTEL